MDANVLSNVKRSNISLDAYKDISQHLREAGRSTKAELIMLLPGETKETFINGISEIIDSGATSLTIYTLQLLYGTEFKDPEYRKKFGIKGKFRIVPLDYGEYDSKKIFDYEEVAIQTNTTSFKEYLDLRGIAFFIESLINGRPFDEFFSYSEQFGITRTRVVKSLQDNMSEAPKKVQDLYKKFIDETKDELWESEEELLNYYRKEKNYLKLKKGLIGGNLIYKYKSISLLTTSIEWIQFLEKQIFKLVDNNIAFYIETSELKKQLSNISKFCNAKLDGIFDLGSIQSNKTYNFDYDIIQWIDDIGNSTLTDWKLDNTIQCTFGFSEDQIDIRKDQLSRYGSNINSLSKLVTRISNLESQIRKIKTTDSSARDIYHVTKVGESFTRYTLAS